MNLTKLYFRNIAIAIDQFINTLFGGDPDETISSRAGKSSKRWGYILCRCLHWIDRNHCIKSIEYDEGKDAIQNND